MVAEGHLELKASQNFMALQYQVADLRQRSHLPSQFELANARVKNFTKPDVTIRVTVNFGVAYGSDVSRVKRVVLDAVRELDDTLQEPTPQVLFLNIRTCVPRCGWIIMGSSLPGSWK